MIKFQQEIGTKSYSATPLAPEQHGAVAPVTLGSHSTLHYQDWGLTSWPGWGASSYRSQWSSSSWPWQTSQMTWSWQQGSHRGRRPSSGCGTPPCRTSGTECGSCYASFQRNWYPWSWRRVIVFWNKWPLSREMLIKMLWQQYKQHLSLVFIYLELQLLEEPSVLSALVSLLELGADHVSGFLLLHGILQHTVRVIRRFQRTNWSVYKQVLYHNTTGMVYMSAMEDRREQQVVLLAGWSLSCIVRVSPTLAAVTQRWPPPTSEPLHVCWTFIATRKLYSSISPSSTPC